LLPGNVTVCDVHCAQQHTTDKGLICSGITDREISMGRAKMCKKSHWGKLPPWVDKIGLKEVIKG
jgi:hypothetical protein